MHEVNRSYDVLGRDRLLADGASPFSLIQPCFGVVMCSVSFLKQTGLNTTV